MIRVLIYGALMWAVCGYALFRGGRAERIAAAGILVATYATVLVLNPSVAMRFRHIEVPMLLVDSTLFLVLLGISLRSEKYWPLWLTAMQALTILTHFAPHVPHVIPWAYANAAAMWAYPMLIILGVATRQHHRQASAARYSTG